MGILTEMLIMAWEAKNVEGNEIAADFIIAYAQRWLDARTDEQLSFPPPNMVMVTKFDKDNNALVTHIMQPQGDTPREYWQNKITQFMTE